MIYYKMYINFFFPFRITINIRINFKRNYTYFLCRLSGPILLKHGSCLGSIYLGHSLLWNDWRCSSKVHTNILAKQSIKSSCTTTNRRVLLDLLVVLLYVANESPHRSHSQTTNSNSSERVW